MGGKPSGHEGAQDQPGDATAAEGKQHPAGDEGHEQEMPASEGRWYIILPYNTVLGRYFCCCGDKCVLYTL